MINWLRHRSQRPEQTTPPTEFWTALIHRLEAMHVVPDDTVPVRDIAMTKDAIFYDVMMQRLDQQMENADSADTKIGMILTVASLLLPVFAALLAGEQDHVGLYAVIFAVVGGIAYLSAVLLLYLAYLRDDFSARPDPQELAENVQNPAYNLGDIRFWIAVGCGESLRENERLLNAKARLTTGALIFVILEFFALSVAVLFGLRG